jgi:acyl-CoA synthetase (AMP-forming)/AMP-acid ligase II
MKNTGAFLNLNENRYPENVAIVYRDQRVTYRELNQRVNRLAHHLMDMGVQKGDRAGLLFYNCNQFVEFFFAVQKIGAIAVPVNFRLVPREVKWILDNSQCQVLAYSHMCSDIVDPVKGDFSTVKHLIFSGDKAPSEEHHFETMTRNGITDEPTIEVGGEDPCCILFTGGTTGFPKGAVYTHYSLSWNTAMSFSSMRVEGTDEVKLGQLPLFHQNGMCSMVHGIASGGKSIFVDSFDSREMLRLIHEERVSYVFFQPPSMYLRLLDHPEFRDFDLSSVTRLGGAAGVMTKQVMLRLYDAFPNAQILYGYGCTEAGGGTINYVTRAMVEQDSEKRLSVGREMAFIELRLVDDDGREVPVGEMGEAIVRGPMVMKEYYNQPELTAQAMKDGWLHTGDILKKDQDGFYYFMDRKKDMIKSGGENVFAQEVEGVIMSHPSVEICAVIGVPDPVWIEAVMAVIKLRPGFTATEEEIIAHCKQYLASYKKPRRVAFVDSFPLASGIKIQKFKLREQYGKLEE